MPRRGVAGRAKALGTVAAAKHARLTAAELVETIAEAAAAAPAGSVEAGQAAEARRQVERAVRIPARLASELAEARALGQAAWQEARRRADFAAFEPHLARLIALKKEEAAVVAPGGNAYDALLDVYEPGATSAALNPLFTRLRGELSPLVKAVAEAGRPVDEAPARGHFPFAAQRALALELVAAIGFDLEAGRLDGSTHPFCVGINPGDVRLTWRWQEDDFRPALYGVLHEAGHGLYEQGLPPAWFRTPLGDAVSLGIHESQSRLWENQVGRSRAFWQWALPRFQAHFGSTAGLEQLWPTLHVVRPSLIRVEADEATYNLHVLVRFELEKALFAGDLSVAELPAAWDDLYAEVLGVRPANAAEGVLQDIHWSMGSFGYFPTYTLGTLAAAQLFAAAERACGSFAGSFAGGDFSALLAWLRSNVHRHGSTLRPAELVERATGKPLGPEDFMTYLRGILQAIYQL